MSKHWKTASFAFSLFLSACAGDTLARPGLEIEIRDARTGAPAAYDATVVVREGSYVDTIRVWEVYSPALREEARVYAADNRPGTYEVTVLHPQYQPWQQEGIRVTSSGDGSPMDNSPLPRTVRVRVDLQQLVTD